MWPNPQETADLVTFTEEILNGKFNFLCSGFWLFLRIFITDVWKSPEYASRNFEKESISEAVSRKCAVKMVFLKISHNSQENACVRVSFLIILQASDVQHY